MRTPGEMRIPQWAEVTRLLTSNDVGYDEDNVRGTPARTNLTDGVVYFTVIDDDGNIVIQKTSADINEIEIRNQGVQDTRGQAVVKFTRADTAGLTPGTKYWFDAWAYLPDGTQEPIVDLGRFHVDRSATDIVGGAAPIPGASSIQSPQFRNFQFTVPSDGDSWTVSIPGSGMVDENYTMHATISGVPNAASPLSLLYALNTDKSGTEFVLRSVGAIEENTVVDLLLRSFDV